MRGNPGESQRSSQRCATGDYAAPTRDDRGNIVRRCPSRNQANEDLHVVDRLLRYLGAETKGMTGRIEQHHVSFGRRLKVGPHGAEFQRVDHGFI